MPFLNPKLGIDFSDYIADPTLNFTGRTWVFEAIQKWLADPQGERFFLLTGEPGSGKTAIAARLTQVAIGEEKSQQFTQNFLKAIHFCSARHSLSVDPKNFTESITLQLAQIPAYANLLKDIDTKQINIQVTQNIGVVSNSTVQGVVINNLDVSGVMSAQEAFNLVVLNPLEAIYKQGFSDSIVILVDSLDEALTHVGETKIVDLLSKIPPSIKARFILTSRKQTRIESEFTGVKELSLSATEFKTSNQNDIETYIKNRLKDQILPAQFTVDLNWQEQQVSKISELSEGNFLYTKFLLDAVSDSKQSITELGNLPKGLDALYFDSLRRVVRLGKKDWRSIYAPCLGVLSIAQESLTVKQIQTFTHQTESVTLECLNDLRQFVDEIKIEEGEIPIQKYKLYHQSVIDFLGGRLITIDGKEQSNLYYTPEQEQHQRILQSYCPVDKTWQDVNLSKLDEYGLRYLTQHLVKAERTEEIHDLLTLETTAKRQAWFEAKDQVGDIQGFIADIVLAWDKAEKVFQDNPGRTIELQCRYALIITSVGKLASNISNSLLISLVENGVWTERIALSYVKQIPSSTQRFEALMSLVPQLVSESLQQEGWQEFLNTALSNKKQKDVIKLLGEFFPSLPELLKRDVIKILLEIPDSNSDMLFVETLNAIIPDLSETLSKEAFITLIDTSKWWFLAESSHLSDHQWLTLWQKVWTEDRYVQHPKERDSWYEAGLRNEEEGLHKTVRYQHKLVSRITDKLPQSAQLDALKIVSALSEENQLVGLSALAPKLSLSLTQNALTVAMNIQDEKLRAWALRLLVLYLDETDQQPVWQEILRIAPTFQPMDPYFKMKFLVDLARHIPESLQQQAWHEATSIFVSLHEQYLWDESKRFISYVPNTWKREVLNRVLSFSNQYHKKDTLFRLVRFLPGELRQEALDAALAIPAQQALADKIAPHLVTTELTGFLKQAGKSIFDFATSTFSSFSEYETIEWLCNLYEYLPHSLKQKVLSDVFNVNKEDKQSKLFQELLPNLDKEQKQQVLQVAQKYRNENERVYLLYAFLPHLSEPQRQLILSDLLQQGLNLADEEARVSLLRMLMPSMSELKNQEKVLGVVFKVKKEDKQSELFQELLPNLNEEQKQQVLQFAQKYRNENERVCLLYAILPHLSEPQRQLILPDLLRQGLNLADEEARVSLLRKLMPSLSELENQQILDASFSIKDGIHRLNLLYPLYSHISESSKLKLLKAIEEIKEDKWRAEGLQHLMPRLSNELQQEALRISGTIKDAQVRAQTLEKIAASLPDPLKQQALKDALYCLLAIGDEKRRGILVYLLANSLPSSLVQSTLKTSYEIASDIFMFFQKGERGQGRELILKEFKRYMPNTIEHKIVQQFLASKSDSDLVDVLRNPVKNLPPSIRLTALQEYISSLMKYETEVSPLEIIAPQLALLPSSELYILWCYFLKDSVNYPRPIFLTFLHPFIKVITTLGGKDAPKAVALAIQDVGRWWP